MSMDYESWRCMHDEKLFCPPQGCSKSDGCCRDLGWLPAGNDKVDERSAIEVWKLARALAS